VGEPKNAEGKVEQALMLLASVNAESISVKEAVEIVELVTAVPELVRKTIAIAEEKGIVKREGGRLVIREKIIGTKGHGVQVKRRECNAQCMRCGRRISTCFFLIVAESEFGPFGSECIKRLRLG
jgi:hypothetical protein